MKPGANICVQALPIFPTGKRRMEARARRQNREQERPARARVSQDRGGGRAFPSQITVSRDGQSVDARSIMGLMMLAASEGSEIAIEARGPDADIALAAIVALANAKFGEE